MADFQTHPKAPPPIPTLDSTVSGVNATTGLDMLSNIATVTKGMVIVHSWVFVVAH
jgi:hypothetical protein